MARLIRGHGVNGAAAHAAAFHNRERRREAHEFQRFASLISSNFDLGTASAGGDSPNPLEMLGSIIIGVSFSDAVTAGQLTVDTSTGRTLGTPILAADQIYHLGYFEKAVTLTPSCAIAGTVTLYAVNSWRKSFAIATGVFS